MYYIKYIMSVESYGEVLSGEERAEYTGESGTIITLARRQFPAIASKLREFERLSMEQRTLAAEIDQLQDQKARTDEERALLATEIREYMSTH